MTNMKTIKTAELTGAALDWAVSKCEGVDVTHLYAWDYSRNKYSTDWSQGGPIIERLGFSRIVTNISEGYTVSKKLVTLTDDDEFICWVHGVGPTILIAAMRCYVASKLGDTVEVPKELTT
jgi:hypothetical protein